jgi:hypothetical protein
MIVDLILNRKDGEPYNAKDTYIYITEHESIFNKEYPISRAFDGGTNKDVQNALSQYITDGGYNSKIIDYIRSVDWV